MNLSPLSIIPFDDPEAFEDFSLAHGMAHQKIAEVMYAQDLQYDTYPLMDTPDKDTDWKLTHYTEHQSIYFLLELAGLPDLATVDFHKEDEFNDWFFQHQQVHAIINAALGIVS